jgi:predicted transcriptional regulator of viral defense system
MKVDEWLQFFKQHSTKKLFSVSDLSQLINEPKTSLMVQLTRLTKAKIITRVAHGWYANPFSQPTSEEVSMVLRIPSYLSLEYALSRQGILSQRPYTITLVTTQPPYTFQTEAIQYEYHQIQKSLFWGYTQEKTVCIAHAEKALLDLLYIRGVCTKELSLNAFRSLLEDMDLEALNTRRLQEYTRRFGQRTIKLAQHLNLVSDL